MVDSKYTPISYVRYRRVTFQEMNYIQTQFRNCERIRRLDALPYAMSATAGDVVFLNTDNQFYGFDGTQWGPIGGPNLPISDAYNLLKNEANPSKQIRFDLSQLTNGATRIFITPDKDGVIALMSDVPVVNATVEGAVLYRGVDNYHIEGNDDVLIARTGSDTYIDITKGVNHTGHIIQYVEVNSLDNDIMQFRVENTGRTISRRLCLFSGGDG